MNACSNCTASTSCIFVIPQHRQFLWSNSNPNKFNNNNGNINYRFLKKKTKINSLNLKATSTPVSISASSFPLASKIFVKNLEYSITESCLEKEFSSFGEIAEVKIVRDGNTKQSKGYAFIQYTSQDDAILAMETMDHKMLNGRLIFVEIARLGRERFRGYPITSGPPKTQNLKGKNEIEDCWY